MPHSSLPYYELCILIPCYNNTPGLRKSIESIRYDKSKYLIVVVDDGSEKPITDHQITSTNGAELPLCIIRIEKNGGIVEALNTGLRWIFDNIACDFIARLDCGDICDPSRYYKQINYLRENTYVMLLGSWCYFKNFENNFQYSYKTPEHHPKILNALYFRNVFIHPTLMFRRAVFDMVGQYPHEYPFVEDYALCWRIANVAQTAILPAYLVVCEISTKGISNSNRIKQLQNRKVIVATFGSKFALKLLGTIKLNILLKVPDSVILFVKRLMSF